MNGERSVVPPGDAKEFLRGLLVEAIKAADPAAAIADNLPARPKGRTIVIGAGKASARMAQGFEAAWHEPVRGLIVTRYGHAAPTKWIEILEASHPVPDSAGLVAAARILEMVRGLTKDDLVVALISGGGSALLPAPFDGLTLEDEQETNRRLLASGMPIDAMNKIRNELSIIKGGRLAAAAYPARVHTLVVSDVAGDDPALVASGPTVPIDSSRQEVRQIVELYQLELPPTVQRLIASEENLAPVVGDPRFKCNEVQIVVSANLSLNSAQNLAIQNGLATYILSDRLEGEAREVATVLAAVSREVLTKDRPFKAPVLLLSGGETTVTLRGRGKGGRNTEFLLAFALAIDGLNGVCVVSADTDGIDGSEDNAGAYVDGTSAGRMRAAGIDPRQALADNDAWTAFHAVGDLIVTGATGTNVNDFRAIMIS